MKKALILISFFVFTISVTQIAYAGTESGSTKSAKVEYNLAYPGILPDHPLYKLKVLRDKITTFLIQDPLKKIDFYLLQTDKGILATSMLVDKNKIDLAEETALKTEHNMTLLTFELKKLSEKPNTKLFEKLKTASFKHQEVLESIIKKVPKDKQKTFITVLNFSKTNLQTTEELQNRKRFIQ